MKLTGSKFKTNKSEYFLKIPVIGLHDLLPKGSTEGKKIIVRSKKKFHIYAESKNSRVINVIAKNIFWKKY